MKRVVLYGEMGRRFGKYWDLDVMTPAESFRAIHANRPDFFPYLMEMEQQGLGLRVLCGREAVADPKRLGEPFSSREVLRIVPVPQGAGDGKSFIQIGIGALLIYFSAGTSAAIGGILSASTVTAIGASLVLSGVSSLLFQPPAMQNNEKPENKPSFVFDGAVNTILQGGGVPVCYGELEIGSQVISVSLTAIDISPQIEAGTFPNVKDGVGGDTGSGGDASAGGSDAGSSSGDSGSGDGGGDV